MGPPITSTRNPRVRELAGLQRARERRETGRHLVEGPHAVGEALAAGVVDEVFVVIDGAGAGPELPAEVLCTPVSEHVLERLARTRTPQHVMAVARSSRAELADVVGVGVLVVLHEVADPGNAGTILRTADAAGARGVVLTTGSVDPYGPKAVRSAAGSTYHLPIVTDVVLAEVVRACRAAGQRVVALDGTATDSVFDLERGDEPVALVLGNEAHGFDPGQTTLLPDRVSVPIRGRAESLNVAAAAAVAIYATTRGRSPDTAPGVGP
jgi:RNA methyltransferase, TrmH family